MPYTILSVDVSLHPQDGIPGLATVTYGNPETQEIRRQRYSFDSQPLHEAGQVLSDDEAEALGYIVEAPTVRTYVVVNQRRDGPRTAFLLRGPRGEETITVTSTRPNLVGTWLTEEQVQDLRDDQDADMQRLLEGLSDTRATATSEALGLHMVFREGETTNAERTEIVEATARRMTISEEEVVSALLEPTPDTLRDLFERHIYTEPEERERTPAHPRVLVGAVRVNEDHVLLPGAKLMNPEGVEYIYDGSQWVLVDPRDLEQEPEGPGLWEVLSQG